MSERTLEAINADIERLNTDASSAAAVLSRHVAPDASTAKAAYEDSQLLALSVLGVGIFVLCCLTYLFKTGRRFDDLLRSFATILIIVAAVFLVVAGYSEKQIAPVIGLLGTIAGYVLGKSDQRRDSLKESAAKSDG